MGQTNRGTLTGTVTDSSGAPIPAATVVVIGSSTGTTYNLTTSSEGVYAAAEIPFGHYKVHVEKTGFRRVEAPDVVVTANQLTVFDTTLQLGNVTESITVTAASPILQTKESETVQENFSTRQILELPMPVGITSSGGPQNARSPETFTFLTPGVVGDTFLTSTNGGQQFSNEVILDGARSTPPWAPGDFNESAPSVDALGEFTIMTANFPAQYGWSGSSVTSFAYKSGGNQFHGSMYDFLRNRDLDGAGFYDTGDCTIGGQHVYSSSSCFNHSLNPSRMPALDQKSDFGLTAGGPVIIPKVYDGKNRSFFFFSFEGYRQSLANVSTPQKVPTAQMRAGDFSQLLTLPSPIVIYDPTTRQPFAGNAIPQTSFDKVANYSLQYIPAANMADPSTGFLDLYQQTPGLKNSSNLYTWVIDHNLTEKQRLHFSWSHRINRRTLPPDNNLPVDNPLSDTFNQRYITDFFRGAWDYSLTPTVLNHLNLGLQRIGSLNHAVSQGHHFVSQSGLTGVADTTAPNFVISGYLNLGASNDDDYRASTYELADNLTWVHGKHTVKFGGSFFGYRLNIINNDGTAGIFNFTPQMTGSASGVGGAAFASFLLGAVSSASAYFPLVESAWRERYPSVFAQDSFKATRKLTINWGLRWDIDLPRVEAWNQTAWFDPTLANPAAGGIPGALAYASAKKRHEDSAAWKDFGPRVGLSYALGDRTVLHAGYGVYYSVRYYNDWTGADVMLGWSANPFFASPNGIAQAFSLQSGFPQNFAHPPFSGPSSANLSSVTYVTPASAPPYIQSWNFGIERELSPSTRLSVAYVGNKGTRLYLPGSNLQYLPLSDLALGSLLQDNINDPAVQAQGFKPPYPTFASDYGTGATLARALIAFPQYQGVNILNATTGYSNYNSLQAVLQKKFSSGLQFTVTYTASKALGDADNAQWQASGYQTFNDLKREKSVTSFDVPNNLEISYLYELPIGRGKRFLQHASGPLGQVISGWEVTGTNTYMSGFPLSLSGYCPSLALNFAGACRPELTGSGPLKGPGASQVDPNNGLPYINPAAFTLPPPYSYGDTERNMSRLRGFPTYAENLGIVKNFRLKESAEVQFRMETFNLFNRVKFNDPSTSVGSYDPTQPGNIARDPTFGYYVGQSGTVPPRVIQFVLKIIY
jgi:hypothetical protein